LDFEIRDIVIAVDYFIDFFNVTFSKSKNWGDGYDNLIR
jgi:hypothetical protein